MQTTKTRENLWLNRFTPSCRRALVASPEAISARSGTEYLKEATLKLPMALAALALSSGAAAAQSTERLNIDASGSALLNITAEGRSERRPDLATFNAGVVTQARTAAAAMSANNSRMNALVAALRRSGVAERDIQTSNLNLQPQYFYPQPPAPDRRADGAVVNEPPEPQAPRIIGYEARNTVTVRLRRIDMMGEITDILVTAGANQVDGPFFSLDKPDQATDEARVEALRAAKTRADMYAREAGFRRARIVSISEGGGYFPVTQQTLVTASRGMGAGAPPPPPPPPPPVQPGEVSVGASLSVQFALER